MSPVTPGVAQRSPGHARAVFLRAQEPENPSSDTNPSRSLTRSKVVVSELFKSIWGKKKKKQETLQSVRYIPVMTTELLSAGICFAANESVCVYKEAIRAEGLKLSWWDGPSQELIPLFLMVIIGLEAPKDGEGKARASPAPIKGPLIRLSTSFQLLTNSISARGGQDSSPGSSNAFGNPGRHLRIQDKSIPLCHPRDVPAQSQGISAPVTAGAQRRGKIL